MARIVVTDTGPILHIKEADGLSILKVYEEILVPPLVRAELERFEISLADIPGAVAIEGVGLPSDLSDLVLRQKIHVAEAEAIVCAEARGTMLLTDDLAARQAALRRGLEVRGVFGVVLESMVKMQLSPAEASDWVDRIAATSLFVTPRVLTEVHRLIEEFAGRSAL